MSRRLCGAGGRDLERPPRPLLPAHVGEVGHRPPVEGVRVDRIEARARRSRRGSTRPPRPRCSTGTGSMPASAASAADSAAQTSRVETRATALLRRRRACPTTGRMRPSSASSPTAACSASRSGGSCLVAASTASEIGRSKPEPSFRSAAGARLTVIRRFSGHSSDAETTPLRTRCFASWQARSASPTMAKPGTPGCRCASTSTLRGSRPTSAWVTARASTPPRWREGDHREVIASCRIVSNAHDNPVTTSSDELSWRPRSGRGSRAIGDPR